MPALERSRQGFWQGSHWNLALCLLDWIWDPAKGGKPSAEIEQQPRRPRIAVPRLSHRTRIEKPASFQFYLGPAGCESAHDLAARLRDRECDMAVADEHDRRRRELERGARRFFGENVLPDRIARACVKEIDAVHSTERLEFLQEVTRLGLQDLGGPARRRRGLVVEVAEIELTERDEVVVAH